MMLIINVDANMRYAFGQIDVLLTTCFSLFLQKQLSNTTINRYFHVE
ncbi:hypothetical protein CS533_16445 [Yersinia bercovieri]|uniref:Uncharacterized protein n=1 Tax=Yersinia bercovieri TaxID=634 RepID=A0A2G4TZ74_YERBE|nr:hypothetical protein CS533_16445 [Yersinia bercovieri]